MIRPALLAIVCGSASALTISPARPVATAPLAAASAARCAPIVAEAAQATSSVAGAAMQATGVVAPTAGQAREREVRLADLEAIRDFLSLDEFEAKRAQIVNDAVAVRPAAPAQLEESIYKLNKFIVDTVYKAICLVYDGNDYARFFVLETVARVPYFAYLSVMHLRETFGSRDPGDGDRMRTHYAEADNELHHLLIMESLGGNSSVVDRTLAQTMAFTYYWYVIAVYTISEQAAYHLSELIEDHAFNTYNGYLEREGEKLKTLPVPDIARQYYEEQDPYLFDKFCTVKDGSGDASQRRPKLESLYDVFVNVRDDEKEHWKTLCNLVQFDSMEGQGQEIASTMPTPVLE